MPPADFSGDLGEIYFEFTAIGRNVKVVAIHAASGTEVSVVGPASAARSDLERLALDEARLAQLGALELLQPLALSCFDHEGGGAVKFQQWLGERWNVISDWVSGDQALVRRQVEQAAAAYARDRGIALRDCSSER